jgi:large subunit ribosomal protein L21
MSTYAIVKTGGKQYRVQEGQWLLVERLRASAGEKISLQPLLYVGDGELVDGDALGRVSVDATVLGHERGPKLRIVKFKPKRGYRRRNGHRQELTRIKVTGISLAGAERGATAKRSRSRKAAASRATPEPVAADAPVAAEAPAPVAADAPAAAEAPAAVAADAPVAAEAPAPVAADVPVPAETPAPVAADAPVSAEASASVAADAPAADKPPRPKRRTRKAEAKDGS